MNEELSSLPYQSRLLFAGLWVIADRDGRLEDRPARIKSMLFPYDELDVDALLQGLCNTGFIQRYVYDSPDGPKRAIAVPTWSKHQTPHHREKGSVIPPPNGVVSAVSPAGAKPGLSLPSKSPLPSDPDPDPDPKDQNSAALTRVARLPFLAVSNPKDDAQALRVLTKLAHEIYDVIGLSSIADASDALKERAAKLKILASPDTFRKALDSAAAQRARKRG